MLHQGPATQPPEPESSILWLSGISHRLQAPLGLRNTAPALARKGPAGARGQARYLCVESPEVNEAWAGQIPDVPVVNA